ncbi:MAG: hypothetical protein KJ065_19810 [Anaerolineae bacterium]|nr:hypothetical protein [Anaerolineae bacterium]
MSPTDLKKGGSDLEKILPSDVPTANRQDTLMRVLDYFKARLRTLKDADITMNLANQYVLGSQAFHKASAIPAAITLLLHGWENLGCWQRESKSYTYRAAISNELSAIYFYYLHDVGAATWWALHTQANDLLRDHSSGGGRDMLQTVLSVPDEALKELKAIALENLSNLKSTGGWAGINGFAEEVIRQFAAKSLQYSHILAQNTLTTEFPLSKGYYQSLLDDVANAESEGRDHTSKKNSLERLASYLFLLLPGCIPRLNVRNQSSETDVVIRNLISNSNLLAEIFGRYFIAECKNWEKPVGVPDVGYFLYRMRLTHSSFGVLFAKNGITGAENDRKKAEEIAAKRLIRNAYHEDKILCVVLTLNDLKRLRKGSTTFRSLLLELSEEFRFGK